MTNYYKYLPVSKDDEQWGLHVLNVGCNHIPFSSVYPGRDHPSHHYFSWDKGRILTEYQTIYITNGEGVFESATGGTVTVRRGSVILLFRVSGIGTGLIRIPARMNIGLASRGLLQITC